MATWHEPFCAVSSCLRGNWPSHRRRAKRAPEPKQRRRVPTMARGWKRGSLHGSRMPTPPWRSRKAGAGDVAHAHGAIMWCVITSSQLRDARDGHIEDAPRRQSLPRWPLAIPSVVQGPSMTFPQRRREGRSWRRPSALSAVQPVRASGPIRSQTPLWPPAFVGSRILRPSGLYGLRNLNGLPPWRCSRS